MTLLRQLDVARQLGVDRRTVARLCDSGELACLRLSKRIVRFTQAHVDEYLRKCEQPAVTVGLRRRAR